MSLTRALPVTLLLILSIGGLAFGQTQTPELPTVDAAPAVEATPAIDAAQADAEAAADSATISEDVQAAAAAAADPVTDAATDVEAAAEAAADPHAEAGEHGGHHKNSPNPLWILPFAVVLACIALGPLFFLHWWEHKYPYVAAVLFVVGLVYYLFIRQDLHPWLHEMREYVSFIALLSALYVVSGGIVIHVSRKATPAANVLLLLTGAVFANVFGTTGAAMLLIRPYIRINKHHIKPYHIVFFIFIVANVGGCLTPVGDPPLFLGYLKGVPFWWVLEHCWQPWAVATALLLVMFFVIDKLDHAKEERHDWGEHDTGPAVRINGIFNIMLIIAVIAAVFQGSVFEAIDGIVETGFNGSDAMHLVINREVLMLATGAVSYFFTKKGIHETNAFTFGPIREVAILFLAIFSTMVPALEYLDANADKMPLKTEGHFYFATGTLSGVLDNAPTYLTFLQARLGEVPQDQVDMADDVLVQMYQSYEQDPSRPLLTYLPEVDDPQVLHVVEEIVTQHEADVIRGKGHVDETELKIGFLTGLHELNRFLVAISIGAVFFGAMTYIGNAPNFMVKSIAESSGIKMPSFLGYIFRYSLPILLPVLIVIWAIFLM